MAAKKKGTSKTRSKKMKDLAPRAGKSKGVMGGGANYAAAMEIAAPVLVKAPGKPKLG
ncbi:MAG TPA: hypothetical protein VMS64_13035 [Candidatus Methylomirabilis sp.]|nr:hypothetical protein [Candidatus Methylomirabilis sp.]